MAIRFDIKLLQNKKQKRADVTVWQDDKIIEMDNINLHSRISRRRLSKSISKKTDQLEADLESMFLEAVNELQLQTDKELKPEADPLANTPQEIKEEAYKTLNSAELFDALCSDFHDIGIAGERNLTILLYLIMTSRLLDRPLSAIVCGASASGKSFMAETLAELIPPECKIQAHDFTDEALFYMKPNSLKHKVVIAGERVENKRYRNGIAEDNTKAFREMLASGKLRKAVALKNKDAKYNTEIIEQLGPIAYIESTTSVRINEEDATRLLPLVTDESAKQTECVIEMMQKKAKSVDLGSEIKEQIIEKHHAMQRLLKPLHVIVSYADSLSLPASVVATRRSYGHLLSIIKTVTILRQYQKKILTTSDGSLYIEADEIDYNLAYSLIARVLERTYSPINEKSRVLFKIIKDKALYGTGFEADTFTIHDIIQWTGVCEKTVRNRLVDLIFCGIVSVDKSKKPYKYQVAKEEILKLTNIGLPSPEEMAERIAIMCT